MNNLLKKSQENLKANTNPTEQIDVVIKTIRSITDERRVMLITDKGTFFVFKNQFDKGVTPAIPSSGLKAKLTLEERTVGEKTFINVTAISYDVAELSAKHLAATFGNALVIA